MDNQLQPNAATNTESTLSNLALQQAATSVIDIKGLDFDGVAIVLFTLAEQLEAAHPGICARHGWAKLTDLEGFAEALSAATQATPPGGLH